MKNKTTQPQYAQGEWKIKEDDINRKCSIVVGTSKLVAKTMYGDFNKEEAEANAQRIVKAVNMYDELIDALKESLDWIEKISDVNALRTEGRIKQLLQQSEQK